MEQRLLFLGIGFDQVESTAWHTLVHSILSRSSKPIAVIPIKQSTLRGIYTRERDPKQSNEFSFTRFLLPYLCQFQGWSVFMDCDMLVRTDIDELFQLADDRYAVQVVKHDYSPANQIKYLGTVQYTYPKKNWSSVMLFNNERCRMLTPDYVNQAPGLDLHQFKWLQDDGLIGDLPLSWNWLVGEYPAGYQGIEANQVKNAHFTVGGPYFVEYARANIDFAAEWFSEHALMDFCLQRAEALD
jgi:hypothetical protein